MSIHGINPSGGEEPKPVELTEQQERDNKAALIEAKERKRLEFLNRR